MTTKTITALPTYSDGTGRTLCAKKFEDRAREGLHPVTVLGYTFHKGRQPDPPHQLEGYDHD